MKKILLILLVITSLIGVLTLSGCTSGESEYVVIDTSVVTENFSMPARITIPEGENDFPAVVMVHGSGPNDMNESIGKLKMFEDLAINLAKRGIASIRYDKRTYTHLNVIAQDKYFTINAEVIDDALSAVNLLKTTDGIDIENIYILGHSFGGQLAPVIANRDETIKGVIMMAGTTMHIIDLLMEQLKEQNDPTYDQYDPWDEYFRDMKIVKSSEIGYYFAGAYMTYWVSYNNIDLKEETISCAINKKMLIMQGGKDLQVKANEIEKYQEWLMGLTVTYKTFNDLNHYFVDGKNETIYNAYQVKKNIDKEVVDEIIDFMKNVDI